MITVRNSLFEEQTTIIQMISSGMPLKSILTFIVESIENNCDSFKLYGSILLYNPLLEQLVETASSSLPTNFIKAIEPIDVSPYGDSCGTAAFLKQPIIVSDIQNNALWDKNGHIATSYGFRACWSIPLLSSKKELIGMIVLYKREVGKPDEETMNALAIYNKLASLAIEISANNNNNTHGLHCYEFDKHLKGTNETNKKVLRELYTALERGEFEVFYQPYFGINQKLLGVEALIRWNHPHLGLLTPASFLGAAEETGFILELEKWVLTKSINKMRKLYQNGWTDLRLSVNISAQQFENPRFPKMVEELLKEASFHPENLTLEVTERFLIHKENINIVNRFKATGIKLSIDDFGTAYSSLQYLKDLNIDEIKIDRCFISNLEIDNNSQKIVEMIIMLGHQLNLNIVAEGVETEMQLQLLKKMKCDSIQGFLFSKPIPFNHLKKNFFQQMKETWSDNYVFQKN
ncbi:EAL domain-containing protein [Lysinibacillus antri]|uniref:EAL domain-containing protein n=2 Tax=Lysinibacillus antri TaxID=2498145 RepID=A0A3S0P932_9BACI|nr:EAL domain-containing protein [Lysinibacillus antri]